MRERTAEAVSDRDPTVIAKSRELEALDRDPTGEKPRHLIGRRTEEAVLFTRIGQYDQRDLSRPMMI